MNRLIALSYSPWSEKARWALLHHRIAFVESAFVPMLGAPLLRLRTRKFSGRITVPALLTEAGVFMDSWDIARFAEAQSQGRTEPLFPAALLEAIAEYTARGERLMEAGRALSTRRIADDPEAQVEALPDFLGEGTLRNISRPVARLGVRYFNQKYDLGAGTEAERTESMRNELLAFRAGLGGSDTLFGPFTFAEIAMTQALQFVRPIEEGGGRRPHMKPATRRCFTHEALAAGFEDLLAWRDATCGRHQP